MASLFVETCIHAIYINKKPVNCFVDGNCILSYSSIVLIFAFVALRFVNYALFFDTVL